MCDFKSHFWQDFLAYCPRPVSVHLVMVCVGCSFNSFSVFLLSLKQQQNLMKIMFSCIHFPVWPYPPKIMKKMYFIQVNCMGWQVCLTDNFLLKKLKDPCTAVTTCCLLHSISITLRDCSSWSAGCLQYVPTCELKLSKAPLFSAVVCKGSSGSGYKV